MLCDECGTAFEPMTDACECPTCGTECCVQLGSDIEPGEEQNSHAEPHTPRCCHGACPAPATVWRGPTPYCEKHARGM